MNDVRLFARYAAVSVRAQMQYPASLMMLIFGQFLTTVIEFAGVWVLFDRFQVLGSWTLAQVGLFYGTVNTAFALAETISRGFDVFGPQFVRTGDFDRLLLRPRSTALQLLGYELRLTRIGRLLQGLAVVAVAVGLLDLAWDAGRIVLLIAAILGGIALFVGLLVLQATLAFWTVESLEVANTLTHGGVQTAQYPLDIYSPWLRNVFTFVVPLACVAYFPVVGVLGIDEPNGAPRWFLLASPLAGPLFLVGSLSVWRFGVRHYASTGG